MKLHSLSFESEKVVVWLKNEPTRSVPMGTQFGRFLAFLAVVSISISTAAVTSHGAGPVAVTKQDLLKCGAVASASGVAGSELDVPNAPPYVTRYGNKLILAIIDIDPVLRNLENRVLVLQTLVFGAGAGKRSITVDKARYLLSVAESDLVPGYLSNIPGLLIAIRYCNSKRIDMGDLSVNELMALQQKSDASAADIEAGRWSNVSPDYCKPHKQSKTFSQGNYYVAGLPDDFCKREAYYREGVGTKSPSNASASSSSGGVTTSPQRNGDSSTNARTRLVRDTSPSEMSCSQIAVELEQQDARSTLSSTKTKPRRSADAASKAADSSIGRMISERLGSIIGGGDLGSILRSGSRPSDSSATENSAQDETANPDERREQLIAMSDEKGCQ